MKPSMIRIPLLLILLASTLTPSQARATGSAPETFAPPLVRQLTWKDRAITRSAALAVRVGLRVVRYKVTMDNLKQIRANSRPGKGTLFYASHPGFIDPLILVSHLWPDFQPRPIIKEEVVDMVPGLRAMLLRANALIVPKIDGKRPGEGRRQAFDRVTQELADIENEIVAGVERGENFVIYPSGTLMTESKTKIGSASMAFNLVQRIKDPRVVLVQMNGINGSMTSHAYTGKEPVMKEIVPEAVDIVLRNGILFVPKRRVPINLFEAPAALLETRDKKAFNLALDDLLNDAYLAPIHVPHDFGGVESIIVPAQEQK